MAGADTGFWLGWDAKDFIVREAREIMSAPNPNFWRPPQFSWGVNDFFDGALE